jgi:hypothetical protein
MLVSANINQKSVDWKEQLNKLTTYIECEYGCKVSFGPGLEDAAYPDSNLIEIDSAHIPEYAVYYLLHEIGHIIQRKRQASYQKRFRAVFDGFSRSSKTKKVACLGEEFDAWDNGLNLADDLEIPINRKCFETLKTKCLLTYIRWAGIKTKKIVVVKNNESTKLNGTINDNSSTSTSNTND